MSELSWQAKAGIGALGGLGLAILKLIDAQFYLQSASWQEPMAGYLTYFCYMILGSLVAVFLTEHDLPIPKLKRSSFVMGLLAPSVMVALLTQPIKIGPQEGANIKNVPRVDISIFTSAYAQEPTKQSEPTFSSETPTITTLTKSQVAPSFRDALWAAVGRKEIATPYYYVIGKTTDKNRAVETAQNVNVILRSTERDAKLTTRILKPEGTSGYYIVLGDRGSYDQIANVRSEVRAAATKSLVAAASDDTKRAAMFMLDGQAVQGTKLLEAAPGN